MPDEVVLTPGGFRHRSLVHRVGAGIGVHAEERTLRLMDLTTNRTVGVAEANMPAEQVPALGSGWITYTYWNNGTGNSITSFATTWHVPAPPATQGNQTIFLFNGIQNYGNNYGILQPVLQWGVSAAGGGPYWSIASWYVTSGGQAFHTSLVPVNVGDQLVGVMTLTGQSGTSFSYNCQFQGVGGTSLPVLNIAELLWCNETLEAYTINQCSDYPAAQLCAFTGINIQTTAGNPVLQWTGANQITDCGQHAIVVSNSSTQGEVDLYFTVGPRRRPSSP